MARVARQARPGQLGRGAAKGHDDRCAEGGGDVHGPAVVGQHDAAELEQRHKLPQRGLAGQIEHATAGKPGNLARRPANRRSPRTPARGNSRSVGRRRARRQQSSRRASVWRGRIPRRGSAPAESRMSRRQCRALCSARWTARQLPPAASPAAVISSSAGGVQDWRPTRRPGGGNRGFDGQRACGAVEAAGRRRAVREADQALDFTHRALGASCSDRGAGRSVASEASSARAGRSRCAAESAPARLPAPSGANWAGPARFQSAPRADGAPPTTDSHPGERDDRIEARMVLPQVGELLMREQGEVRIGQGFAEALQRGRGHHRVAQPIDAADEDTCGGGAGLGGSHCLSRVGQASRLPLGPVTSESSAGERLAGAGGTPALPGAGFHRLCTQNQLAGSRRTAASNARFTSPMMAAVERGPAVLVGGNFRARFDAPAGQADAVADARDQRAMVAQRENGGRGGRRAVVPEEGHAQRRRRIGRTAAPA